MKSLGKMNGSSYLLGVFLAILSGSINNVGLVFQKKVVNEVADDAKFFRKILNSSSLLMHTHLRHLKGFCKLKT